MMQIIEAGTADMPQEAIGQRINFLLQSKNLSIRKLARALDISDTNIRNYIDRGSKPSSDVLERIVRTFPDLNTTWLLLGEGDPFLPNPTQTHDQAATYATDSKKISHSQVVTGSANTTTQQGTSIDVIMQLENTKLLLIEAKRYSERLEDQLADKERLIQAKEEMLSTLRDTLNRLNK